MRHFYPNFREQFSTVTAFIDASTVYGSDDRFAALLREDIFSFHWNVLISWQAEVCWPFLHCTENSKQIFSEMNLCGLVPNFYIHVCERFIYSHDRSPISCIAFVDRSCEYINRSQIHDCRNWNRGRAVSFLWIIVSNFRYSVCIHNFSYLATHHPT